MNHPFRRHPLRRLSTRIPSIPGDPLYCPKCEATARFSDEESRTMHYFQEHVLVTPKQDPPNCLFLIDYGNYDGPLGKKQHVFPAERYCQEPESYLTVDERVRDEMQWRGELEMDTEDGVEEQLRTRKMVFRIANL